MNDLRIGVIGCGAIGRDHIRRINTVTHGAIVSAVCDVSVEIGNMVANQWGALYFENGEDLIHSNEVDAIIVATLDEYHELFVIESVKCGKYVLCEKPLAPTADACQRIMESELSIGRKLVQVGFMRRYDEGYRTLRDAVKSQQLGEPILIHCAHRNAVITDNYDTPMLITNVAVHELDVLRWLLDEDYKLCQIIIPKKTRHSLDKLNDPLIVLLETASGVRVDIEIFVNCQYGYDIKCEVVCEDGTISLPVPAAPQILSSGLRYQSVTADWKQRFISAYDVEFQDWIYATKAGRVDGPTSWDGYACAVASAACVMALKNQEITLIKLGDCPDLYM